MARPDSTPLLRTIHCPTLIVVGDEDTMTPPALSEEMHRAIAGSELTIIPGAGHLSSFEQPAAFNSALASFLTIGYSRRTMRFMTGLAIADVSPARAGHSSPSRRLRWPPSRCHARRSRPTARAARLVLDTYVRDGDVYYRALKTRPRQARRLRQTAGRRPTWTSCRGTSRSRSG